MSTMSILSHLYFCISEALSYIMSRLQRASILQCINLQSILTKSINLTSRKMKNEFILVGSMITHFPLTIFSFFIRETALSVAYSSTKQLWSFLSLSSIACARKKKKYQWSSICVCRQSRLSGVATTTTTTTANSH